MLRDDQIRFYRDNGYLIVSDVFGAKTPASMAKEETV
jgi:hypothetical protein